MNEEERLQLKKMVKANNAKDNSSKIQELKHSSKIETDVKHMLFLKRKYPRLEKTNNEQFNTMCVNQCSFLYNNYTDIFNKLFKNLIDVRILYQFLQTLKKIEAGDVNQHEASVEIGRLLKKIYIDSALKENEINDKKYKKKVKKKPVKNVSWNDYKNKFL